MLSSDDEEEWVPSTAPASSGAVRGPLEVASGLQAVLAGAAIHPGRVVLVSQELPVAPPAGTLPAATVFHHVIGAPRESESEGTVSIGRASERDNRDEVAVARKRGLVVGQQR